MPSPAFRIGLGVCLLNKSDGFHFCLHTGADLELWYLQMKLNWKVCNCQGVFSA